MAIAKNFYTDQAEACTKAASETDLPMLRQKYESAGAAWLTLANREKEIAAARDRRIADNAAKAETPLN